MPKRLIKSALLGVRTRLKYNEMKHLWKNKLSINSQLPIRTYSRFMSSFPKLNIKGFKTTFSHADSDGVVMLSLSKWVKRKKVTVAGRRLPFLDLKSPSNVFKSRFILTRTIEPHLNHPTNGKPVCVITRIQGPGRKYTDSAKLISAVNSQLSEPWQNYLLRQMIEHAKTQGMGAVAFLKPENNPNLDPETMQSIGVGESDLNSMKSQSYAAARKNKMKKVKGSKYFWIYFN